MTVRVLPPSGRMKTPLTRRYDRATVSAMLFLASHTLRLFL